METIICCEISSSQEGCGWGLTMVPSSQYMVIVGFLGVLIGGVIGVPQ